MLGINVLLIQEVYFLAKPSCRILRIMKQYLLQMIGLWATLVNTLNIMVVAANITPQIQKRGGILKRLNVDN